MRYTLLNSVHCILFCTAENSNIKAATLILVLLFVTLGDPTAGAQMWVGEAVPVATVNDMNIYEVSSAIKDLQRYKYNDEDAANIGAARTDDPVRELQRYSQMKLGFTVSMSFASLKPGELNTEAAILFMTVLRPFTAGGFSAKEVAIAFEPMKGDAIRDGIVTGGTPTNIAYKNGLVTRWCLTKGQDKIFCFGQIVVAKGKGTQVALVFGEETWNRVATFVGALKSSSVPAASLIRLNEKTQEGTFRNGMNEEKVFRVAPVRLECFPASYANVLILLPVTTEQASATTQPSTGIRPPRASTRPTRAGTSVTLGPPRKCLQQYCPS